MKYYTYSLTDGTPTGTGKARVLPGRDDWDDDDPKKYQLPAGATFEPPLLPSDNKDLVVAFDGVGWGHHEDHRGEVWYKDGEEYTINFLGPIPDTLTLTPPPPPTPERSDINDEWDRRRAAGFQYAGRTFHSTEAAMANIAVFAAMAQAAMDREVEAGDYGWVEEGKQFTWSDIHGGKMPIDAPGMVRMNMALGAHILRCYNAAQAIKAMDPLPADFATNDDYWK